MNKRRRNLKVMLLAVCVVAALTALGSRVALAQCAMCRSAVSNSINAAKLSRSLNLATVILFIPPVTIFCAFFFVAYRRARRANSLEEAEARVPGRPFSRHARRRALDKGQSRTEPDNPSPLASPN